MSKFTAGPWNVRTSDGSIGTIDAADGTAVAQAFQVRPLPDDQTQEERRANARLIAAAPELLEALREMLDAFQYTDESDGQADAVVTAKLALAKATGEQP